MIQQIEEPSINLEWEDWTNPNSWALLYNEIVEVLQLNMGLHEGRWTEGEKQEKSLLFSQKRGDLAEKIDTLEFIYSEYLKLEQPTPNQEKQMQLLFYGIELARL